MVVIFEFLGNEPIENVITCMNYKADKVVFFGFHDVISNQKENVTTYLKKYCGVQQIVFHSVSDENLQSILKTMRKEIDYERSKGSRIYFDITGGESLILVAFGMLAREYNAPIHFFDIPESKLIELDSESDCCISKAVMKQKLVLNLDQYIEMQGGRINSKLKKDIKNSFSSEFENDITQMWKIAKKYVDYWNPFSDFLRAHMVPDEFLRVSRRKATIMNALSQSTGKLNNELIFNQILKDLAEKNLLLDLEYSGDRYQFRFKNDNIKSCLWEGGSILELYVYQQEKKTSDDCRIGVHLDWDGILHNKSGTDVLNEIDVLSLSGYVPTFISCKSGNMGSNQILHALYELDTVAKKFGGKYARKVLVTAKKPGDVYIERAQEMGIEIRKGYA